MRRLLLVHTALVAMAASLGAQGTYEDLPGRSASGRPGSSWGRADSSRSARRTTASADLPLLEGGKPVEVVRRHGRDVRFELGRDNPAFPNPNGAMHLGSIAGNCYTMAFVTKLFFESGEYDASDTREPAGFDLKELADHLADSRNGPFRVRGFASLFEMTDTPGFGESEVFDYLSKLHGAKPEDAPRLAPREKMVVQLVRLVTTIHYLHYLQTQASSFLRPIVESKLQGIPGERRLTRSDIASIQSELDRGRTSLVALFNTAENYGHVVLAHGVQSSRGAHYLFLCDSNTQCRSERRHSVLKVSSVGRVEGLYLRSPDGSLVEDRGYEGQDWWSKKETLCVVQLPAFPLGSADMRALARKALVADEETAYLVAGGALVHEVTMESPDRTSLRESTLGFLRNVGQIQRSLGQEHIAPGDRLDARADVRAINRFLEKYTDLGVRTAWPYALPRGISVGKTRLRLDEADPNRAYLDTRLTLSTGATVDTLTRALSDSAMLRSLGELGPWVQSARNRLGDVRVTAQLELELRKQALPRGWKVPYGLMPVPLRTHVVLGDIEPSRKLGVDHQLEISKRALQAGLETAVDAMGLIGKEFKFTYDLELLGQKIFSRTSFARIDKLGLDLRGPPTSRSHGVLQLQGDFYVFVRCNPVDGDKGISVAAPGLNVNLHLYRKPSLPRERWHFFGDVASNLKIEDGLGDVVTTILLVLAEKLFPLVKNWLNEYIETKLDEYVTLEEPIGVHDPDLEPKTLFVNSGEALLDVDSLAQRLFQVKSPVTIDEVRVEADRLVLGASSR
ncbi:MAG: hypothetical protein HY816_13870 [Candidatus Wallbacteria bacterium]|nr:hypothetical protein [Candidatus Wallbacteria bacterium]